MLNSPADDTLAGGLESLPGPLACLVSKFSTRGRTRLYLIRLGLLAFIEGRNVPASRDHFKWINGKPMVFTNFHQENPVIYASSHVTLCGSIERNIDYMWTDSPCARKQAFICKTGEGYFINNMIDYV